MFIPILLTCSLLGISYAVFKLWSMRAVDRQSLLLEFVLKTRIATLLGKLNIRPKEIEVTASNGVTTLFPHPCFQHTVEHVLKFDVRKDDVFIATYPKAGTTWMQEIVWLMCNNCDINAAKKESILSRTGFLEIVDSNTEIGKGIISLQKWPQGKQRIMKTHMRFELLPENVWSKGQGKVIYVARNPKDVCVSYYHFHRMNRALPNPGTWSYFFSKFCSGIIGWGSWFDHNLTYWQKYHEYKNQIYFVKFEDLKKNLRAELEPLAEFLGKNLTPDQYDAIANHCKFDSMSRNEMTNYSTVQKYGFDFKISKFIRKGEVGDWKNYFTISQNEAFDAMYEEKMKGSGLDFAFEL